ncbi:MAG: carboxylesterase/lipase family protein [Candidatus Cryptobacteroides sp.]|nr:carboxylesterase/lipase family protein [Bacteroidales bacterium]MDY3227407.1 carboxylesterase/lipase family protein [Candidatus Cryptobacteroides sp.]MDY4481369.1 carboxylesterase/lipase family protein [Candidatus Cryptobacteroides sp.]MDY5442510.1 carboxylesterase/lipase family protein [Candidatus Cryptobacteroides sp.]MDY5570464.1 carboxylesterase/lipase family protein [Candidatus Cryptobacteroides sp.]
MKTFLKFLAFVGILTATAGCCSRKGCCSSGEDSGILASSSVAVAQTANGKVAGYIQDGVTIFKGIPYAKANRFEAPVQADSWEGIRSCRQYGPVSPQGARSGWANDEIAFAFNWNDGVQGEDCLRLNVWTPALDSRKRPVMVWLHGGGYSAGSGQELPSYDGTSLAFAEDVVVVSINHRLNVLGFLDLSAYGETYAKSANAGLLDIVASLKWVRDNIAAFGGDPSNVTIFGQSGGGGKVTTLLATPCAKGLFHKAIVQSGSMLRTMESKYSRKIGIATVRNLGLDASSIDKISEVPYGELLAAGEKAIAQVKAEADRDGVASFIFGWAPTVDGAVLPSQPFDPQAPAISAEIPMIIGTTRHEFSMTTYVPALRNAGREEVIGILKGRYGEGTERFLELFAKAYPGSKPADMLDADFVFRPGAIEQALRKSLQGAAPVYMYMFNWESPVLDGILRSTHCMEIPFVFNNADRHASMTGGGAQAMELASKMSHCWAEFARCGKPSAEGLPEWEPFEAEKRAVMFFDNTCKMSYSHDKELMDFIRRYPTRGF